MNLKNIILDIILSCMEHADTIKSNSKYILRHLNNHCVDPETVESWLGMKIADFDGLSVNELNKIGYAIACL